MKKKNVISWIVQILTVSILFQTLFFKFSGASESKELFTKVGIEPWGRYLTGILEFIAGTLILIPRYIVVGAIMGTAIMIGAIISHILFIGIESQNDGGVLFFLAIIVFACCISLILMHKNQLNKILDQISKYKSKK